jgi:hypothetical protein
MLQNHLRIPRWAPLVGVVLSLCFAPAAWAQAPSLADVARKEQERRKTAKPPAKVYTNKDLPESAQNRGGAAQQPAPAPASGQPTAAAPIDESKATEKPAESDDQKGESWWRNRIMSAREELRRNEVFAEALQTRINSLSTDFVNRDDPFQRAKIGEDRDKALAELARVKDEIARARKGIEDIEEEARKSGVPPGWLR